MTLTVEEFRQALPDKMKKSVNDILINQINSTLSNPEEFENYRNNLISYTKVLADGKFKISQYLDAVRYVSFKLLGATNIEAYTKAFPDKYKKFLDDGVAAKDIASYVTAYNKGKLVNLIMEQTLVPFWVLNQDLYQKALNTQVELMLTANSEKVRCDAANSVMTQLKPPEVAKVQLEVSQKEDSTLNVLRDSMMKLVHQQKMMLEAGVVNAQDVAHQKLVFEDVESREVE